MDDSMTQRGGISAIRIIFIFIVGYSRRNYYIVVYSSILFVKSNARGCPVGVLLVVSSRNAAQLGKYIRTTHIIHYSHAISSPQPTVLSRYSVGQKQYNSRRHSWRVFGCLTAMSEEYTWKNIQQNSCPIIPNTQQPPTTIIISIVDTGSTSE